MSAFRTVAAALVLAGSLAAQTVDLQEYMPLGAFNQWNIVQEDDPTDTYFVKVTNVNFVDGIVRYSLNMPFFDTLDEVRLVMGFDGPNVFLYRIRFQSDQLDGFEIKTFDLDPPVLLGTTTSMLDGAGYTTAVNTSVVLQVEIGPFDEKIDVDITGTITSQLGSVGQDLDTPSGTYAAADLVAWTTTLNLTFDAEGETEDVFEQTQMMLAKDTGIVFMTNAQSSIHLLKAAILPGTTIASGDVVFDPFGTTVSTVAFDTPGLFTLDGNADAATTGGDFVLSDINFAQLLSGNVILTGTIAPAGGGAFAGDGVGGFPIELKGKARISSKTGMAKVSLKGKTKKLELGKALVIKAKADVGPLTESIAFDYKSGKEIFGTMNLGVSTTPADNVLLTLNPLVDTKFIQKKARILGAEGTLSMGGKDFPVTLIEKRKSKEGFPDKHTYTLVQTGTNKKILKVKAESTSAADYLLTKFKSKLFGLKIKPADVGDVGVTAEDSE